MSLAAGRAASNLDTGNAAFGFTELLVLLVTVPRLIWRILDERKLLSDELRGYPEYSPARLVRRSGRRG